MIAQSRSGRSLLMPLAVALAGTTALLLVVLGPGGGTPLGPGPGGAPGRGEGEDPARIPANPTAAGAEIAGVGGERLPANWRSGSDPALAGLPVLKGPLGDAPIAELERLIAHMQGQRGLYLDPGEVSMTRESSAQSAMVVAVEVLVSAARGVAREFPVDAEARKGGLSMRTERPDQTSLLTKHGLYVIEPGEFPELDEIVIRRNVRTGEAVWRGPEPWIEIVPQDLIERIDARVQEAVDLALIEIQSR